MPSPSRSVLVPRRRRAFDSSKLYALTGVTALDNFLTQAAGGEQGLASGFGTAELLRFETLSVARYFFTRVNAAFSQGHGYSASSSNNLNFVVANGSGANVFSPARALVASDVGKLALVIGWMDGSAVRVMHGRVQSGSGTAVTGFTAATTSPTGLSGFSSAPSTLPAPGISRLAQLAFRGVPNEAQLQALSDAVRTLGDIPSKAAIETLMIPATGDAAITALAPPHWYRADTATTSGANLTALTNRGSAGGTLNATGNAIAAPAADALFNGQLSILFTTDVTGYLVSSLSASAWRFLHDGTGGEVFLVFAPTAFPTNQAWLATGAAGNVAGMVLYNSLTAVSHLIQNGTGTVGAINAGVLAVDTPTYLDATFALASTPDMVNRIKSYAVSAGIDVSLTPAAGDPASTLRVGGNYGGGQRSSMRFVDLIAFNRILSEAERQTVRAYLTDRYAIDKPVITHRWSLRDALIADARGAMRTGQVAPGVLADTVTAATVDAMARTGTPVVQVIDPSVDGRASYGAIGSSPTSYLQSTIGIRGAATGITCLVALRVGRVPSSSSYLVSTYSSTAFAGYSVYGSTGGSINVYRAGPGDMALGTCAAADVGITKLVGFTWDGTTWRAYQDGAPGTTATAAFTYTSSNAMQVGRAPHDPAGGDFATILAVAGCDVPLSGAEMAAVSADWQATGRLRLPAGKVNPHVWEIGQDVIANGGPQNGIPAQVLDRVGTDHLTRMSGLRVDSGGLTDFSASQYVVTPPGARALQGSTTAWSGECLIIPRTPGGTFAVVSHSHSATAGYSVYHQGNGNISIAMSTGTTIVNHSIAGVPQNAVGHLAWVFTGTTLRVFYNGTLKSSAAQAAYAFTASASTYIGVQNGSQWPSGGQITVLGVGGSNTVAWSDVEVAAASAASLAAGKLVGVPSKTDHLWSIIDDVVEAGTVPAAIADRVSGVDHMAVVNNKLEVSQRKERLWSYESTPILYGAEAYTLADYFEAAVNALPGDSAGFMVSVLCSIQTLVASRRICAQRASTNLGWEFQLNASQVFFACGGTNSIASPGATITADLGKLNLFTGVWDNAAGLVRLYAKRVQVSTGSSLTGGFAPSTTISPTIGRSAAGATAATGVAVYGLFYALGIPTLAQVQAQFDAVQAQESIQPVPGFSGSLIDLKRDITSSTVPATLLDRTGSANFTKIGSPAASPQYARAFAW